MEIGRYMDRERIDIQTDKGDTATEIRDRCIERDRRRDGNRKKKGYREIEGNRDVE